MHQRDRSREVQPHCDCEEVERKAEKSRKRLDELPEHGSDPLHEGLESPAPPDRRLFPTEPDGPNRPGAVQE